MTTMLKQDRFARTVGPRDAEPPTDTLPLTGWTLDTRVTLTGRARADLRARRWARGKAAT